MTTTPPAGQQPTTGQLPPQDAAKPSKPWYKKIWVWAIAVVVIIAAASAAGGGGRTTSPATPAPAGTTASQPASSSAPSATSPSPEAPKAPGIGTAVTSGPFEMTVTKVEPGVKVLGTDPISTKPQGQFVVISMTVKNTDKKAEYFFSDSVKLLSADKVEYSVSTAASIYLGEESALFEQINPGNTLTGKMAFDIPVGVTPTMLQFSGGLFDKAVEVSLG